jgi:rhodanese-related sulfurtransferase
MFGFGRPSVPTASPQEASARLAGVAPGSGLMIDVREADEFARARVPGSILLPLGQLAQRANELPADRPLFVVCQSGSRSGLAVQMLLRAGFTEVTNVAGGIVGWWQAGLPIETGPLTPGEGELSR